MSKIIIITGPSGVGKGTIEKELFKDESLNLVFSISATTREKRANEEEGKHYHFITKEKFEKMIEEDMFIEWNKHFDNYYGTPFSEINKNLNNNKNVLVEVETTGAINIIDKMKKAKKEDQLISIFITPPSIKELKHRIIKRQSENKKDIRKRLKKAKKELKYKIYFNHIIENNEIEIAINKIKNIIRNG